MIQVPAMFLKVWDKLYARESFTAMRLTDNRHAGEEKRDMQAATEMKQRRKKITKNYKKFGIIY